MKKISALFLAGGLLFGVVAPNVSHASSFKESSAFKDVPSEYTFFDEINYLSSERFISGFKDGTFKPDEVVTRAQAAIMLGRVIDLDGEPRETNFKDVTKNVTGSGYIVSAVEKGIISGFPDNTYRPNEPVTRGQMAMLLNRSFAVTKGNTNPLRMFHPI